jgi:hypothetical protein
MLLPNGLKSIKLLDLFSSEISHAFMETLIHVASPLRLNSLETFPLILGDITTDIVAVTTDIGDCYMYQW